MYLQGLLVLEAEGEPMIMFHGTTQNGAENIIQHGLRNRAKFDVTNMAGEFWCTSNHAYASLMALMDGYDPPTEENPPCVLKFNLPTGIFRILREGKHYDQHGEGAFEFRAPAFKILNQAIQQSGGFEIAPLTADAEQKWQAQLHKNIMQGVNTALHSKPEAPPTPTYGIIPKFPTPKPSLGDFKVRANTDIRRPS